jgi:hypothetical protein
MRKIIIAFIVGIGTINGTAAAGDFACDLALPLPINEFVLAARVSQVDWAKERTEAALEAYEAAGTRFRTNHTAANEAASRQARIAAEAALRLARVLLSERNDCQQIVDLLKAQQPVMSDHT